VTAAGLLREGSPANVWITTLGLTSSHPSWRSHVDLKNIDTNPSAPGTKLPKTTLGYGSLDGKFVVTVDAAYFCKNAQSARRNRRGTKRSVIATGRRSSASAPTRRPDA